MSELVNGGQSLPSKMAGCPSPDNISTRKGQWPSDDEFHPKRPCSTPRSADTPVVISRDILKRVGPAADRLGVSHQQASLSALSTTVVETWMTSPS